MSAGPAVFHNSSELSHYSVTAFIAVCYPRIHEKMQSKYRLFQRALGVFYWQETGTSNRGSLKTKDREEADRLLAAKNEAHRQPILNLAMGRAYLAAHDPEMITRTWQRVFEEMATHGIPTTQDRCARALRSRAYNPIREKPLVETTAEDLLKILHSHGNTVGHYLRRVHNLALNLGWLAWPVLPKNAWPKIRSARKRGTTPQEQARIIAAEQNVERRAYYELLYETGAAQTDAANLDASNVDWTNDVLIYRRKKLGPDSEPARLTIGKKLRALLETFPKFGPLFPTMRLISANHRASEFRRRCKLLGIEGITLHSYRYAWAQRAKACGYPLRFAQEALGHSSRAVHEAYAKGATVTCPALDEYESVAARKLIALPLRMDLKVPTSQAEADEVMQPHPAAAASAGKC